MSLESKAPSTVALIGYRGTGKTTVAQLLARSLSYDWVDADVEVELRAGKSIAAIFADEGEQAFRDAESLVVAQLCGREHTVLALGGGAVLRGDNRKHIARCGAVVWLTAGAETLVSRLEGDPTTRARRPNLTNRGGQQEIRTLLAEREPIYRACATHTVDTEGKPPAEVAAEVLSLLAAG
ncbi:MAG: shikimate kinase [Planctomycetota bacterium]